MRYKMQDDEEIVMRVRLADQVPHRETGKPQLVLKGLIAGVSCDNNDVYSLYVPTSCAADLEAVPGVERRESSIGLYWRLPSARRWFRITRGSRGGVALVPVHSSEG